MYRRQGKCTQHRVLALPLLLPYHVVMARDVRDQTVFICILCGPRCRRNGVMCLADMAMDARVPIAITRTLVTDQDTQRLSDSKHLPQMKKARTVSGSSLANNLVT